MKHLLLLVALFVSFAPSSIGQSWAMVTDRGQPYPCSTSLPASHQKHKASTLSSIGGCTLIAGVAIYALGYLKVENAKSQGGSLLYGQSVDNQSKINTGHTMETIGEVLAAGGLVMILVDVIHPHHKKAKVEVVSPEGKSLGLVYNF